MICDPLYCSPDDKRQETGRIYRSAETCELVEQFREQHGNVHYFISESVDDPDVVIVSDLWETKADFDAHCSSEIVKKTWAELYDQYVVSEKSNLYEK